MKLLTEAARLYEASKYREAEERLLAIPDSEPAPLQARVMLGVIYARTKRHALAIRTLEPVIAECPDQVDALVWLATSMKASGELDEATSLCERAVNANPHDPAAYNARGLCYLANRRVGDAIGAFNQAVRFSPGSAPLYHNLGLALRVHDDCYQACNAFRKAVSLDPLNEANYLQLYQQHFLLGDTRETIADLEQGYRRIPNSIAIQDALAVSYCRANQKNRGEALFRRVMEQRQGYCHSYSLWLQEEGRFEESIDILHDWLKVEPIQGMAYFCLAEAKAFEFEDGSALIDRATAILDEPSLRPIDRMYLAYSLGHAYEHCREYEWAMRHFDLANALAFQVFNECRRLDFDAVKSAYDRIMQLYSKEFLDAKRPGQSASQTPVFIVGMIRSGTTLANQILAAHPMTASVGEQSYWKLEGARITPHWYNSGVGSEDLRRLSEGYEAVLRSEGPSAERIFDKQPLNYEMVGLIRTVYPKARFIHMRRNPMDTCLSIYTTHFGGGPNFAYNQENTAFVYRQYLRMMDHWRNVIPPDSLLEVDYERLVSDTGLVAWQMVDFCALPWDDACMRHTAENSVVTTPSRWQARQAVYGTSVGRWRRFEPWLGELLSLSDLA